MDKCIYEFKLGAFGNIFKVRYSFVCTSLLHETSLLGHTSISFDKINTNTSHVSDAWGGLFPSYRTTQGPLDSSSTWL